MPALQVRDFPDELYEELKRCAANEHRSIAQQTVVAVRDYLASRERAARDVPQGAGPATTVVSSPSRDLLARRHREAWDRVHELPRFDVPEDFPSTVEILRELREDR